MSSLWERFRRITWVHHRPFTVVFKKEELHTVQDTLSRRGVGAVGVVDEVEALGKAAVDKVVEAVRRRARPHRGQRLL